MDDPASAYPDQPAAQAGDNDVIDAIYEAALSPDQAPVLFALLSTISRQGRLNSELVRHLERAQRLVSRMNHTGSRSGLSLPALVIDARGHIVHMDEDFRCTADIPATSLGRHVEEVSAALSELWRESVSAGPGTTGVQAARAIGDDDSAPVLLLTVTGTLASAAPVSAEAAKAATATHSIMVLAQKDGLGAQAAQLASAAFGLTPAECRVAFAVAEGRKLSDIASRSGVSRETVKKQLDKVFEKTGTHRQASLTTLILQLATLQGMVMSRLESSPSGRTVPKPDSNGDDRTPKTRIPDDVRDYRLVNEGSHTTRFLLTKDRRKLCYSIFGDTSADARPLLLLHPTFACRGYAVAMDRDARALKRKVFVLERPGYGETDPAPGLLRETALADMTNFLDHLGMQRIDALGIGSGAGYAWEYAHRHPDRIHRLAIYSPRRFFGAPDTPHFSQTIFQLPGLEKDIVEAIAKLAMPDRSDEAIDRVTALYFSHSAGDDDLLKSDESVRHFCRHMLRMTLVNGLGGIAEEMQALSSATAESLYRPLSRPVIACFGERDGINPRPNSLELIPTPDLSLRTLPGHGHLAFMRAFGEVLVACDLA